METEHTTFQLDIVMPDRLLFSGAVSYACVCGEEGYFGVLPGHCRFISNLKPGALTYTENGKEHTVAVGFGLADVSPDKLTILAEHAARRDELDASTLHKRLQSVEKDISKFAHDKSKAAALHTAYREQAVLKAQLGLLKS